MFGHEVVDGDGTSYDDVGDDFDSELFEVFYLGFNDFLFGKAKLGYAVDEYAAGMLEGFENGYFLTFLSQIARTGQTRRAAADDGDFLAVGFARLVGLLDDLFVAAAMRPLPVGDKALEGAYGYGLAFDSKQAGAFALHLLRTYSSAYRRQGGVFGYDVAGFLKVTLFDGGDEFGYFDSNGAFAYAHGLLAMEATMGFGYGLLFAKA